MANINEIKDRIGNLLKGGSRNDEITIPNVYCGQILSHIKILEINEIEQSDKIEDLQDQLQAYKIAIKQLELDKEITHDKLKVANRKINATMLEYCKQAEENIDLKERRCPQHIDEFA